MAFSRTWNAAYEAQPADVENISLGAGRIRNLKSDIQERLEIDHFHAGDAQDGEHKKLTFGAPIATPANIANKGFLYGKDVNSKIELHWEDEDGNEIQITSAGVLIGVTITGEIRMWTTSSAPTGWVDCDGSAISRTTFAGLFAVIGTTFGVGDGSTTFNIPDFDGRVPLGAGTGDASDATAHALADKEGTETHTLSIAEMPAHTHEQDTRTGLVGAGAQPGISSVSNRLREGTTQSTGGGGSHNNLQPSLSVHFIIKT